MRGRKLTIDVGQRRPVGLHQRMRTFLNETELLLQTGELISRGVGPQTAIRCIETQGRSRRFMVALHVDQLLVEISEFLRVRRRPLVQDGLETVGFVLPKQSLLFEIRHTSRRITNDCLGIGQLRFELGTSTSRRPAPFIIGGRCLAKTVQFGFQSLGAGLGEPQLITDGGVLGTEPFDLGGRRCEGCFGLSEARAQAGQFGIRRRGVSKGCAGEPAARQSANLLLGRLQLGGVTFEFLYGPLELATQPGNVGRPRLNVGL